MLQCFHTQALTIFDKIQRWYKYTCQHLLIWSNILHLRLIFLKREIQGTRQSLTDHCTEINIMRSGSRQLLKQVDLFCKLVKTEEMVSLSNNVSLVNMSGYPVHDRQCVHSHVSAVFAAWQQYSNFGLIVPVLCSI